MNQAGQTVKGATNIATTQTTSSATFATLATPDQVTVVLPTNGLIAVWYQAQWRDSAGTGQAAIFLNSNQVQIGEVAATPQPQAAAFSAATANFQMLASSSVGLLSNQNQYNGDVTTGQIVGQYVHNAVGVWGKFGATVVDLSHATADFGVGGPCWIFAAAGTYTVSVQFLTTGTLTAQNRKLWVQALSFS